MNNRPRQSNNSREGKREKQTTPHNRKPGAAKWFKNRSTKNARRGTNKIYREMVNEPDQRFINITLDRKARQEQAIRNPEPQPYQRPRQNLYRLAELARLSDSEEVSFY